MKNILSADFVTAIIKVLREMRKGAVMVIFFMCVCCGCIDYILRKHGINEDWFTHMYITVGMICITSFFVKVYNSFCDERDARKKLEAENQIQKRKIAKLLRMFLPAFNNLSELEKMLLHQFVEEQTRVIILEKTICEPIKIVAQINSQLNPLGLNLNIVTTYPTNVIEINQEYYDLLEQYFTEV